MKDFKVFRLLEIRNLTILIQFFNYWAGPILPVEFSFSTSESSGLLVSSKNSQMPYFLDWYLQSKLKSEAKLNNVILMLQTINFWCQCSSTYLIQNDKWIWVNTIKSTDRLGKKMLRNYSRENIGSTVAAFAFATDQLSPFFLDFHSILLVNCEFKNKPRP